MANPGQGMTVRNHIDPGAPPPGLGYLRYQVQAPAPVPQLIQSQLYYPQQAVYQQPFVHQYQPAPLPQPQVHYQPHPVFYGPQPGVPYAQPGPPVNNNVPGINFVNHTGGIGVPPGVDLYLHPKNCLIHLLCSQDSESKISPWAKTPPGSPREQWKFWSKYYATNTTIGEMLTAMGIQAKDLKKTMLYEVIEKGNGKWGMSYVYKPSDKNEMKKQIHEKGWREDRTGHPGAKPKVWLWIDRDFKEEK